MIDRGQGDSPTIPYKLVYVVLLITWSKIKVQYFQRVHNQAEGKNMEKQFFLMSVLKLYNYRLRLYSQHLSPSDRFISGTSPLSKEISLHHFYKSKHVKVTQCYGAVLLFTQFKDYLFMKERISLNSFLVFWLRIKS